MFHRHPSSMLIACALAGVAAIGRDPRGAAGRVAGGTLLSGSHCTVGPSRLAIIDPQSVREPRRPSGAALAKRNARKARNKRKR